MSNQWLPRLFEPLTDAERREMRRRERRFNICFFTVLITIVLLIFGAGFWLALLIAVPK